AHEILWQIWQNSSWPSELLATAIGTGGSAVRANRDLDAICALFDQANRFVGQQRALGIKVFLAEVMAQEIPAEALADNQVRANTVRLLTAHRAKGLEWPLVFVVGVQEDVWPDLRKRQTLLQADLIGNQQELMPLTTHEALIGERRLFYVALTRAQSRVIVTAVLEEGKDEGFAPSRFMEELRVSGAEISDLQISGRPTRALSADGIVAGLRRILADPESSPALQQAVAVRLAKLADSGYRALRSAAPDNWWGVLPRTENPSNAPHEPIGLSASRISAIEDCPAKWFLEREVSAVAQTQNHLVFGTILHSLAQGLQLGELAPNEESLTEQLEMVWPSMPYQAPWISANELAIAKRCAAHLLNWFKENSDVRSIAESSLELETAVDLVDDSGEVREVKLRITGSADRVQFNADGVVVYDYKTSKSKAQKIETNVQLALYSYLIENGTHSNLGQKYQLESGESVIGSALINLKIEDKAKPGFPDIQQVAKGSHDENNDLTLAERISAAAQVVFSEGYEARPGKACRGCPVKSLCPAKTEGRQVI
ncbi:MAG: PD-(D/E)XK nuclease family protein, partial [Actinomycetales bacterium]|nr:PD-(D/E)XK nuclease family protein [Actinomycetales bacterium]